jgi:stage II sporulation protein D
MSTITSNAEHSTLNPDLDLKLQTSNLKLQTSNVKPQTSSSPFSILPSTRLRTILLVLLFSALLFLFPGKASSAVQPRIRLLIRENLPRVMVKATSLHVEQWNGRHWQMLLDKVRALAIRVEGESVLLEGADIIAPSLRVRSSNGMLRYYGQDHRGDLIVTARDSNLIVVASMPIESYLIGIVNGEVDSRWPLDAVMAQVVASRTYALYRLQQGSPLYDIRSDVLDQVYAGVDSEDERAAEAVRKTRGEVLFREGEIVPAFFHSSCGGITASSAEVWNIDHSSLTGVRCGQCDEAPNYSWKLSLSPQQLRNAARKLYPESASIKSLGVHRRTGDGRIQTLFMKTDAGKLLVDAGDFRKVLGYETLPSTRFILGVKNGMITLTGSGYGHGVGLCQWGARGSAQEDMNYREILEKYYPGAEVRRAY